VASFHIVALVVTGVKDYKTGPFYIRLFSRAIVTVWNQDFIRQLPMLPMQQLEDWFSLSSLPSWPNALGLNTLKSSLNNISCLIPEFVCQSQITDSTLYYEQIIQQKNVIPTRLNSWHDLFNGLIWLQFPQTKRLLNQQHVEDIEQYGLSPRTLRRNNLTHFDECGVIVTYQRSDIFSQLIENLKQHQWQSVFVENRQYWGKEINSFIFGHANLEMLLQPFIGLTGKCLAVEVDNQFLTLPYTEQVVQLDELLVNHIRNTDLFSARKPLSPLPLLGIPDVWDANNSPDFYRNTDYFRPLPSSRLVSK
jgi:hypothetical protein